MILEKNNFNKNWIKLFIPIFVLQIIFWFYTHKIKPEMSILDNPPSKQVVNILSFGDDQLYFRFLSLELQNSGDMFGRFTPLKDYDYKKLQKWFYLLDSLDDKSNFVPSIASYYYSQTQRPEDTIYIVEYLEETYNRNPVAKWWWLAQAVYISEHKLKDKQLALRLAKKLALTPASDMPMWAKQMPAFIYEKLGEKQQAYIIIKGLLDNYDNLKQEELNFMKYFIKDRLKMFEEDIKANKK